MMRIVQPAILSALVCLGLAWGACLVVTGIYVLALATAGPNRFITLCLGMASIAAGNFVFMEVVADRLVRAPRRRAMDLAELGAALVMIILLALAAVVWFARSTS